MSGVKPTFGTNPMAGQGERGCLGHIGGFILAVIVVVVGFFVKLYNTAEEKVEEVYWRTRSTQVVVLVGPHLSKHYMGGWVGGGEEQWDDGLVRYTTDLGKPLASNWEKSTWHPVKSKMPSPYVTPQYLKVEYDDDGDIDLVLPIYGIFDSMADVKTWAKKHGYASEDDESERDMTWKKEGDVNIADYVFFKGVEDKDRDKEIYLKLLGE